MAELTLSLKVIATEKSKREGHFKNKKRLKFEEVFIAYVWGEAKVCL